MQRSVNVARAWFFGMVWGFVLSAAWTLSEVFWQNPYRYNQTPTMWLLDFPILWIVLAPVGTLLAAPFSVVLGILENIREERAPVFLWRSFLTGAVMFFLPALWYTSTDNAYSATGWLTGPQRMGLAGYMAALVASYVVGRELPQAPINNAVILYDRFAFVIWASVILSFFLFPAVFFPVFA